MECPDGRYATSFLASAGPRLHIITKAANYKRGVRKQLASRAANMNMLAQPKENKMSLEQNKHSTVTRQDVVGREHVAATTQGLDTIKGDSSVDMPKARSAQPFQPIKCPFRPCPRFHTFQGADDREFDSWRKLDKPSTDLHHSHFAGYSSVLGYLENRENNTSPAA